MGNDILVPISQIADITLGGTPKRNVPEYWEGQINWASAKDIGNATTRYLFTTEEKITDLGLKQSNTKLLPKDTIVLTARGTVGQMAMLSEPMCFNQTCYGLNAKEGVNQTYLFFALKGSISNIHSVSYGTVFNTITKKSFDAIEIPLPPLATQERIADILGTLDDKIELNRQMNHTLEAMARAIFKSWFVDFDPVYAKMEGRDYPLPAEVLDLFPDEQVESELGLIPKGWGVKTINDVVETVGGATPSTKNPGYWEDGIHHFATPKDLSNLSSPILTTTERKVTDSGLAKISSRLLDKGTLLMSSRAPVGYLAITDLPVCINQGFIAMKCDQILSNYYMLNWAKYNLDEIKGRASGTTFSEISKKNFRLMEILEPTSKMVNTYNENVKPLYDKITINIRENKTLVEIRDTLLPKLMSGEVEVL